ncbi:hypothetical protein Tco_0075465 [Tanacetum coccineum]
MKTQRTLCGVKRRNKHTPSVAVFIAEPNHPRGGFHHKNKHALRGYYTRSKRTLGAIIKSDAPLVVVGGGYDDDDDERMMMVGVVVAGCGGDVGVVVARGSECYRGSSRSAHEEPLWCWPENSSEKRPMVAGGGGWWPDNWGRESVL